MRKYINKKLFVASFLALFLVAQFYSLTEYVFAVEDTITVTLVVNAGITITALVDPVALAPEFGIVNANAYGRSGFTVVTNDPDGYTLGVAASTNPALEHNTSGLDEFSDYTEETPDTPEAWSVASGAKEFGFSIYGTDKISGYGTGSCDSAGVVTGTMLYEGFSMSNQQVATRAVSTPFAGIATNICFRVEQKDVFAREGTYTATITGTATVL